MEDAIGTPLSTCERCGGAGAISAYQHIAGGVCYECNGTGYSEQRRITAGHQAGISRPAGTSNAPARKSKMVTIEGLGYGEMWTVGGERFTFTSWADYGGSVYFRITNGRIHDIELTQGFIVDGITRADARKALQAALKR